MARKRKTKKRHARVSFPTPAVADERTTTNATAREGIGWRMQLFVFAIAFAAVVSRRPDALFNPQFFAEDGALWYHDAYMFGWLAPLFQPYVGYFATLPRLVASPALLVPLRFAPLLMNLAGLVLQVLPVNILLSARCRNWAPISVRAFMAVIYIALPNTRELEATITDAHWHLALLACLLVLACVPRTVPWQIFDSGVILLSGLSGPFCIIMLLVAAVFWWFRRERRRLVAIGALSITAFIQLSAIILTMAGTLRERSTLGATPELFLKLFGGQIYLGALIGERSSPTHKSDLLLAALALSGTALVVYCLLKAPLEIKLFVCFTFLVFAASLRNPCCTLDPNARMWELLQDAGGVRYWFFPMLGFAWALVWCLTSSKNILFQGAAGLGFLAMTFGIALDWEYPAYTDFHFHDHASRFDAADPGTSVTIPINPDGWVMNLTKKRR